MGALALGAWVSAMGAVVLVTTGVLVHAADRWCRLGGAWFALGWALVLIVQPLLPAEGYLVATDWLGWSFVLLTAGVIVIDVVRASRVDP